MIALCLIRIAMFEAGRLKNLSVAQFSFARALSETRLFMKLKMSAGDVDCGPPYGRNLCGAVHDIGCIINQAANFQETGRNIEERVEVWKIDAGDESLNSKSHRRYRYSRKPAKTAGAILIC